MSEFGKIIGYESIKKELMQICDMIHNKEVYEKLGAKLPRGVLLYGAPGLGKTLMAKCFVAESGLKAYTIRRNKGTDDFISEITSTFQLARDNAPSIVLLDDMDKFANEDDNHRDAEEYVAVQAAIDDASGSEVFVLATVNEPHKLPASLLRVGRFDRRIEMNAPSSKDAQDIIKYYLKDKKVSKDVNLEDIANMIQYSSCAELETFLNEAAILAAFERKDSISMSHLVQAILRSEYESPDQYTKTSEEELRKTALHEAGHLVVSEVLLPGSVGLASIRFSGRDSTGGFIRRCKDFTRRPYHILTSLAGKAAVELYYSETCASGCQKDIQKAYTEIRMAISQFGTCGFGMIDVSTRYGPDLSQDMIARSEAVVHAELERYMLKARDILLKNRDFLDKAAALLLEKETLLSSDIKALRESSNLVSVAV